ncbi:hypothetical protein O181_033474 [Austropuccinia psidii MF-1]|uniref:Integrase zinc-binding domain-containing protein n=1 Tax=Austropuccinia psidii MF-1 TaxID=1389203 RepID=A0A9Q3CZ99_9BASI|nr:hypothetical protein [Austropuccinia psidii MF-1]
MDLPPSSYYDSLEELWDEEEEPEEIENLMKVFPSFYHQYLDVLSKVQAEKLPPHHACDYCIELEGSLPLVWVIYSLLNQESDTLRAYILENLQKGCIRPSSSSTGVPVLFVKKKYGGLPELNYGINEKEFLCIVWALKCWRAFLLSPSSPFQVFTHNSSLQYFMSSKGLTFPKARLVEFLSEFHFSITYHPGRLATLLDALSCWENVYLERGEDFISKNRMKFRQLIKQDEVQPSRYFAVKVESFSNMINSIHNALWKDFHYRSILQKLGKGKSVQDYSLDSSSQLLLFKDQVVLPNDPTIQLSIIQKCHDSPLAGHPSQEKTLKLVKQDFHWSGMTHFLKDYVSSCQQCSTN